MDARLQQPRVELDDRLGERADRGGGGRGDRRRRDHPGAWIFQYLGYRPCPLCLEQRYPVSFAIPLAVFNHLGETVGTAGASLAALAVIAGAMLERRARRLSRRRRMEVVAGAEDAAGGEPDLGTAATCSSS